MTEQQNYNLQYELIINTYGKSVKPKAAKRNTEIFER